MVITMYNLIAHRALDDNKYTENTKNAALDALNKEYISGIEIDARITKDNKIVVVHDMTINRVSNGTGFVSDKTLKELKEYNFGTKENLTRISTLKDILNIVEDNKIVLIEIKFEGKEEEKYIKYFYKSIYPYLNKNIYVMSFNHDIIKKLKEKHPNVRCGLLISALINATNIKDSYDFIAISSYSVEKVKNYDKLIFVWALKSKNRYKELQNSMPKNTYYIVDKPYKYID